VVINSSICRVEIDDRIVCLAYTEDDDSAYYTDFEIVISDEQTEDVANCKGSAMEINNLWHQRLGRTLVRTL